MAGEGFDVDPEALRLTAKGINDTIRELNDLGIVGMGEAGMGFSLMTLTGMQLGHTGLADTFAEFSRRWSGQVNQLVDRANTIADDLNLEAGKYHNIEQYTTGVAKTLVRDLVGDPHATGRAEDQSWDQVIAPTDKPDLAPADALARAEQTWSDVGRDAVDSWSHPWTRYLPQSPDPGDDSGAGTEHAPHQGR